MVRKCKKSGIGSGSADMAGNGVLIGFEDFYRLTAAARSLESHLRFAFDK